MSEKEIMSPHGESVPKKHEVMRQRVEKLRESDNKYQDSVRDLALEEEKFREDLQYDGVFHGAADRLADKFSDQVLMKFEAEQEKWVDKMTGLRNRNAYSQEVPQLLSMERRQMKNCSLLMVDFDHFKSVNDTYGHAAGDTALQTMADIIRKETRASDIVYRFGGEEFLIFLPDTPSESAIQLAEKIRSTFEDTTIAITDKSGQPISLRKTVSIGCIGTDQLEAWNTLDEKNVHGFLEGMVKCADLAVYHSKNTGRNKVTTFHVGLQAPEERK